MANEKQIKRQLAEAKRNQKSVNVNVSQEGCKMVNRLQRDLDNARREVNRRESRWQ